MNYMWLKNVNFKFYQSLNDRGRLIINNNLFRYKLSVITCTFLSQIHEFILILINFVYKLFRVEKFSLNACPYLMLVQLVKFKKIQYFLKLFYL